MGDVWTLDRIPDLSGRIAIVTGASSGIGLETARRLAGKGARVVLACRDEPRARAAIRSIRTEIPGADAEFLLLDLGSLRSVRGFAEAFRARFDRLDILVNNAGVMLVPHGRTEDGFETHAGTNHLGHFALTGLLIDRLLGSPGSRVVTVTSAAHRYGRLDLGNLMFEDGQSYAPFRAYARSKRANLLFAQDLQRRLRETATISVAAHPGGAATDLGRRATERRIYRALLPVFERLSQSAAEAARSVLRAATDPTAEGGELFGPGGRLGMRGAPAVLRPGLTEKDETIARRLWSLSEDLTGVRYLSRRAASGLSVGRDADRSRAAAAEHGDSGT